MNNFLKIKYIYLLKFIIFSVIFKISGTFCYCQNVPEYINFTATASDKNGKALYRKDIIVEIGILSANEIIYQEIHKITTSETGYFSVEIGKGTPTFAGKLNKFNEIDWEDTQNEYTLKTAVDFGTQEYGNGLIDAGSAKILSVPYSFVSQKSLISQNISRPLDIKLSELNDTKISNPQAGEFLAWNPQSSKWENTSPESETLTFSLSSLIDVNINSEQDKELLTYNSISKKWENKSLSYLKPDGTTDLSADWTIANNNIILTNGYISAKKIILNSGAQISLFSDDETLAGNSSSTLPTQKAVKTYVDTKIAAISNIWLVSGNNIFPVSGKNIGIGTISPADKFHVNLIDNQSFLLTGTFDQTKITTDRNAGTRMVFYPSKAAFRAGRIENQTSSWNDANIGLYSVAFGYDTKASGDYSFAGGKNTQTPAFFSFVYGEDNKALSAYSTSFGYKNSSTGLYTFSAGNQNNSVGWAAATFGEQNYAGGSNSLVAGKLSRTSDASSVGGSNSLAVGESVQVHGNSALATGLNNIAKANYSAVFGKNTSTELDAESSISFGELTITYGKYSLSGGYNTTALTYSEVSFGRFNKSFGGNTTVWVATETLFTLGNGTDNLNKSNAFIVLKNGNTGIKIGDNSPVYALEVGRVGDGTEARANAWNTFSDINFKTDLSIIDNSEEKIGKINGYYYFWRQGDDKKRQMGVVAQEVEKVFPEIVSTDTNGLKSVDYSKLTSVLIEVSKIQTKKIKDLENEDKENKKEIQELKNKISEIEEYLKKR